MDQNRKQWNDRQKELRRALSPSGDFQQAIRLFLDQHAMVHSAGVARSSLWSFEDEVLDGLSDPELRCIPRGMDHSIAWVLWHLTRVEDVTMNILVAGRDQLFFDGDWHVKTHFPDTTTGNSLDEKGIRILSENIQLEALRLYRQAVGASTRGVVRKLQPGDISQRVPSARLDRLLEETVVIDSTRFLLDYWSSLTIAGLLLMPPTRHAFVHLNEAARIRRRIR